MIELREIWNLTLDCTALLKSPRSELRIDLLRAIVAKSPWRSEVGIISSEMHHSSHYFGNGDMVRYMAACWVQVTEAHMLDAVGFAMFDKNIFAKNRQRSANADRDFYTAIRDPCLEHLRGCKTVDPHKASNRMPRFDSANDLLHYLEVRTS